MEKLGDTALYWQDALVIAIYFAMVIGVGIWSSIKSKKDSISGYFLASRNMHWIPVGASLFASNIGSGHFIGLAGSGASSGIGIAGFELNAIFILLILGWFFVPVYMASGVYTMPEYLRKRFGGQRIRVYLSVLALLLYVFTKISADLYAGGIFINQSLNLDIYASIVILLAISALFTITGGLTAVIWTDFVQTILMLIGAVALSVLSFIKVGGYGSLIEKFATAQPNETYVGYNVNNESCSAPPSNYMHLMRSPADPELPWTGMVFGLTIASVWYWCSDQVIVQRVLSAKDLSHAKGGCILAGYLKLLPLFLLVFPGMAARVLFPDQIACSDPDSCKNICGSEQGCTNIAYPMLVLNLMPLGARGLMMSVMLAALMSSLTSIFNSSATIFTMDIWTRIRKSASDIELLIVSRIFVVILVAISIVWIPVVQDAQNSQLFHYIQSVTSYLAPPVCAVYVLAILCRRVNEQGAFWGLMVGLVIGLVRFGWEFSYTVPPCSSSEPDPRPAIIAKVHYLHFGIILFFITLLVTLTVSLLTQPIAKIHLYRLTFWSRHSKDVRINIPSKKKGVEENGSLRNDSKRIAGEINTGYFSAEEEAKSPNPETKEQTVYYTGSAVAVVSPPSNEKSFRGETETSSPACEKGQANWKRILFFVCGVSKRSQQMEDDVEIPTPEQEALSAAELITEDTCKRRICTTNALALLVIASFIWGYYA